MTVRTTFVELPGVGVRMALLTSSRKSCKTGLGKLCSNVTPNAFDAPVFAHKRKVSVLSMSIGHPAPCPAVLAVALLTRFFKLAGMWIIVTETTVARHLDKLYFGKSRCFERDLMALVTLQRGVVFFNRTRTVVYHFVTCQTFHLVFSAVRDVQVFSVVLLLVSKVMAIQAPNILYMVVRIHLLDVTHLLAIKLGQNKFGVVNPGYVSSDWFGGCIVTIPALSINRTNIAACIFREMTDKTNLGAYFEMFFALEVAVACGTKQRQPTYICTDMSLMTELVLIINNGYRLSQ
jgi:hypothetical protein